MINCINCIFVFTVPKKETRGKVGIERYIVAEFAQLDKGKQRQTNLISCKRY